MQGNSATGKESRWLQRRSVMFSFIRRTCEAKNMVTEQNWGLIQKCNFWWGWNPQLLVRVTKNSIQIFRSSGEPWKVPAKEDWYAAKFGPHPSKIVIFDGAQTKQCWPEAEGTLSSLMFWWGILRKSSIRTTCNLPLQVAKHRNQRRWWVDKVWVSWDRMPVQISFFTTLFLLLSSCGTFRLASTGQHINPANWSKLGRACNVMLWWSIGRESCIRTTCNLRLWVVKHLNQRRLESYRGTALAGFEPVTICFRDCFKMPRELGGVQVKNHCVGLRPASPLAEARVTQLATASFRDFLQNHWAHGSLTKLQIGTWCSSEPMMQCLFSGIASRLSWFVPWKVHSLVEHPRNVLIHF